MYLIQKAPEGQECHQKGTCLWEEQRQNRGSVHKLPAAHQSPHSPDLCWALGSTAYMATLSLPWFAWFTSSLASDLCLLPCFSKSTCRLCPVPLCIPFRIPRLPCSPCTPCKILALPCLIPYGITPSLYSPCTLCKIPVLSCYVPL